MRKMSVVASAAAVAALCGMAQAQERLTNGGFEDLDIFDLPEGWSPLVNNGSVSVVTEPVRSGQYAAEVRPGAGGFNAWHRELADPNAEPGDVNPTSSPDIDGYGGDIVFSGYYNIPDEITSSVVGVKLEIRSYSGGVIATTGDILIPEDTTNGEWVPFSYTFTKDRIPESARRVDVLLFTFGEGEGAIYFDDLSLTQTHGCGPNDLNGDQAINVHDLIAYLQAFGAGCETLEDRDQEHRNN